MYHFYRCFLHNVSSWEEVFLDHSASCGDVIKQFGHYENWLQSLELFMGARHVHHIRLTILIMNSDCHHLFVCRAFPSRRLREYEPVGYQL